MPRLWTGGGGCKPLLSGVGVCMCVGVGVGGCLWLPSFAVLLLFSVYCYVVLLLLLFFLSVFTLGKWMAARLCTNLINNNKALVFKSLQKTFFFFY